MSEKFRKLRVLTPLRPGLPEHVFISRNDKTGWSINVSIAKTCTPTKACVEYCYGLEGRVRMRAALNKQAENARFFAEATPLELTNEAVDVVHIVSRSQNFIRVFGVGDLQLGSALFANQMAKYALHARPKFQIWLATRKFDIAANLIDSPNLHVMCSFDSTTAAKSLEAGRALLTRPNFFAAWVHRSPDEVVPEWVSVAFAEHHVGGRHSRAQWAGAEKRTCPATVPEGLDHQGACEKCTFCFNSERRAKGPPLMQIKRR